MASKNINILLSLKDQFTPKLKGTTKEIRAQQKQINAATKTINNWGKNANNVFKRVMSTAGRAAGVLATLGGAISVVTILAYTAIAGMVGAGGLGDIAIRYGHQRGITSVMWVTVVFLIILVQIIQLIFNWLSRRIDKRLDQTADAKKFAPLELLARFTHTK